MPSASEHCSAAWPLGQLVAARRAPFTECRQRAGGMRLEDTRRAAPPTAIVAASSAALRNARDDERREHEHRRRARASSGCPREFSVLHQMLLARRGAAAVEAARRSNCASGDRAPVELAAEPRQRRSPATDPTTAAATISEAVGREPQRRASHARRRADRHEPVREAGDDDRDLRQQHQRDRRHREHVAVGHDGRRDQRTPARRAATPRTIEPVTRRRSGASSIRRLPRAAPSRRRDGRVTRPWKPGLPCRGPRTTNPRRRRRTRRGARS